MESWYEDGQPKQRGELADGERDGPWMFFHPNGAVNEEMSGRYESGTRVGPL